MAASKDLVFTQGKTFTLALLAGKVTVSKEVTT